MRERSLRDALRRKVWAMVRHDGHVVSEATVVRILRNEELILPAAHQRERRQLAERRKAAFTVEPTGPNQVWQLDISEFGGTLVQRARRPLLSW